LLVGKNSCISRYEIELLPTPPVPKMKMNAAVNYQVREIKIPIRDTN